MAINTLVVDDSGVMRLLISNILRQDEAIHVLDTASNGKEAVEKVRELQPDVVIMDMIMGQYDGLYGVKEIMKDDPRPILLLSSLGNTDLGPILEALNAGAFDYLNKPAANQTKLRDIEGELISKVKAAARADLSKLAGRKGIAPNIHHHTFSDQLPYQVILIGASTGGPSAVEKVLLKLPGNLPIPVVIVQHMPENFVPSFVDRLNRLTPLDVKKGAVGMELLPGRVIIAPGGRNMTLRLNEQSKPVVSFTQHKYTAYNYPSVDAVFEAGAKLFGKKAIGIILTGMGNDGTMGLSKIFAAGGYTVAQDERSSIVFGMPREAIKSGVVKSVVPIDEVGPFVVSCIA